VRSNSAATMDIYHITFAVLLVACGWSGWSRHRQQSKMQSEKGEVGAGLLEGHGDPRRFRNIFMAVYLLVMGSDWLQVLPLRLLEYELLTILKGSIYLHTI
jgi:hypothetical protein